MPDLAAVTRPGALPDVVLSLVLGILVLFAGVVAVWAVAMAVLTRQRRWDSIRRERVSEAHAASPAIGPGGVWIVPDEMQFAAVPGGTYIVRLRYSSDRNDPDFTARVTARAVLTARETWWDPGGVPDGVRATRFPHTGTLMEIPALSARGKPERAGLSSWEFEFALDGDVPPSCGRMETLACDWRLSVRLACPGLPDAVFEHPVLVAQPRDRLMAGVVTEALDARSGESTSEAGPLRVDCAVTPVPLDLAAPGQAVLAVTNAGPAIPATELRLEVRVDVSGDRGASDSWTIWQDTRATTELPAGVTRLAFQIPAIGVACPDADLPHGRLRGKLRLVVNRPYQRDLEVERNLCLCLEKPVGAPAARGG